jgi:hypothetical protein
MPRQRIDWENLSPLPRRRKHLGATREDLAERKFNMRKANHKGRCHITNQKRRQMVLEIAAKQRMSKAIRDAKYRKHKNAVRAFWTGETDEHP